MRNFFSEYLPVGKKEWDKENICREIFNNFITVINKFIVFTQCFLSGESISEELKSDLKCLLNIEGGGSGPPTYLGWYPRLFYSGEDSIKHKFEVSSFFTGVPDERDSGGICHLGNGNVQLMYIVISNTIFIAPVYEVYSVLTPYDVRYSDSEWEKEHSKYKPIDFNEKLNSSEILDDDKNLTENKVQQIIESID